MGEAEYGSASSMKFASHLPRRYHGLLMAKVPRKLYLCVLAFCLLAASCPAQATDNAAVLPVSDIKPGMKGVVYTIFEGDQVEKIDLEVIGVLHNAIG